MIIALFRERIKECSKNNWIETVQKCMDEVADALLVTHFREYRVILNHKEERIRIPIIEGDTGLLLLWPAGLLRRRPYPLAVYLFAVCIYITSDISMREAAKITRMEFGLDRFSHSTISRAHKNILKLMDEVGPPPQPENDENAVSSSSVVCTVRLFKHILAKPFVYAVQWAYKVFQQYHRFLL